MPCSFWREGCSKLDFGSGEGKWWPWGGTSTKRAYVGNSMLGVFPREWKHDIHIKTSTWMFIAALFVITRTAQISSTEEWKHNNAASI